MLDYHLRSLEAEDYKAIETALLESGRGRLFLEEYAKRRRATETVTLLDAICRLEDVVHDGDAMRDELEEIRKAVTSVRVEVAASARLRKPDSDRLGAAMRLLDALEAKLSSLLAVWNPPRQMDAAPPAAVDLLKKLQTMTPEERLALLR